MLFRSLIAKRLLGHTEVNKVSVELCEVPVKAELLAQRVVVEVDCSHGEVIVARLPEVFIFFGNDNGVLVGCINLLKVCDKAFHIASSAGIDNAGVDCNMGHATSPPGE